MKIIKKPEILIKAAISIDGKIATKTGDSQWISNEEARLYVHHLRKKTDAILVGVETLLVDNPRLTARIPHEEVRCPIRIIVDSKGRSNLKAHVFNDEFKDKTIIACTDEVSDDFLEKCYKMGIHIIQTSSKDHRVNLVELMNILSQQGIQSIFVEGGGEIIASLLKEKLVDRVSVAIGPILIGGKEAKSFMAGEGAATLKEAVHLSAPKIIQLKDNVILEYKVL